MKNIRQEAFVWVQVILVTALWAAAIFMFSPSKSLSWEAIKTLPEVVTAYALLVLIFSQWAWRWPVFARWLVPFPDLQGTWLGTVRPTETDTPGSPRAPVPATLVIRQNFSSISCSLYTLESESHGTAASLQEGEEGGVVQLNYMYLNRPRIAVRTRSEMHDGAALLSYVSKPDRGLVGEYWTSRRTTGELRFTFHSKDVAEAFVQPPQS